MGSQAALFILSVVWFLLVAMSLVFLDTTFSHLYYSYDFTISLLLKKNKQNPTARDWEESLGRTTYKVSHKDVYMTLSSVILGHLF